MSSHNPQSTGSSERIVAIDLLRGITVAGMILVNNPGSWADMYAPLRHAEWNGLTPTDLVFPFFLFIMGVSTYLSLSKRGLRPDCRTIWKVIRRALLLILIGWGVGLFSFFLAQWFDPEPGVSLWDRLRHALDYLPHMRLSGVFVRLGLTYGLGALLFLTLSRRGLRLLIIGILIGYGIVLLAGDGYLYGPANILSRIDRAVLTDSHMYHDNGIDPEGLLSTLPAVAQVLLGCLVGERMMQSHGDRRIADLMVIGLVMALVGYLLSGLLPLNKKVWSPTFVLVTCGFAAMILGLLIRVTDEAKGAKWFGFFRPFGANALFTYLTSTVLSLLAIRIPVTSDGQTLYGMSWQALSGLFADPRAASLTYALLFLGLNWLIAYPLYKKQIYIKL